MSTALAEPPTVALPADGSAYTDHVYCCDQDLSLCGLDLTGAAFDYKAEDLCPVCDALDNAGKPCSPTCGDGAR